MESKGVVIEGNVFEQVALPVRKDAASTTAESCNTSQGGSDGGWVGITVATQRRPTVRMQMRIDLIFRAAPPRIPPPAPCLPPKPPFTAKSPTLYTDHHGWLQGWLRKKLGDVHQAADLAHDTFCAPAGARRACAGA